MIKAYLIMALVLPSLVFGYEPSARDKYEVQQKQHQLEKYLYEERVLEEARRRLRDHERNATTRRSLENARAVGSDVILLTRQITDKQVKANNAPLYESECAIKTIDYDLDYPAPIEINIAANSPAHIIFYDFTGALWPIKAHAQGDTDSFTSGILAEAPHTYEISVNSKYASASNNLILQDLPAPIVLKLRGDEQQNVCVLHVRIPTSGPNAAFSTVSLSPDSMDGNLDDPVMMRVLRRDLTNLNAEERFISGVNDPGDAWIINDKLYIRTRHWIESPPRAQMQDVSGVYVYRIDDPSQTTAWLRLPNGESAGINIRDWEG